MDGQRYGVSVRENRDRVVVFTAFPSADRGTHLRLRLPWPEAGHIMADVYRPALAERLVRHARRCGWVTTMNVDDGVTFVHQALAANPLPATSAR